MLIARTALQLIDSFIHSATLFCFIRMRPSDKTEEGDRDDEDESESLSHLSGKQLNILTGAVMHVLFEIPTLMRT